MIRLDTVGLNYVKHISRIFIYSFMYLSKIYNRRSILQMTIYSSILLSIYLFIYVWAPTFFWHVCICICTITSRLINSLTYILIYMFCMFLSIYLSIYLTIYLSIYLSIRSHPLFTPTNVFRIPFIQYLSERYMYEICKCIRNIFDINICSLYISLH